MMSVRSSLRSEKSGDRHSDHVFENGGITQVNRFVSKINIRGPNLILI